MNSFEILFLNLFALVSSIRVLSGRRGRVEENIDRRDALVTCTQSFFLL